MSQLRAFLALLKAFIIMRRHEAACAADLNACWPHDAAPHRCRRDWQRSDFME